MESEGALNVRLGKITVVERDNQTLGGNVNKVYRIKFESITDRVPEPVFVVASCATEATATVQRFLDGRGRLGIVLHEPVELGAAEKFDPGVIEKGHDGNRI